MRLKHWPSALAEAVESARTSTFAWGTLDCCLWAADVVHAITGIDPAATWRGTYSTEAEALALLDSLGGLAAVATLAGPEIEPDAAALGDVGLLVGDWGQALGVCAGRDGWWAITSTGLVLHPHRTATRAWGVGRG